jgi:hypothetical protein
MTGTTRVPQRKRAAIKQTIRIFVENPPVKTGIVKGLGSAVIKVFRGQNDGAFRCY